MSKLNFLDELEAIVLDRKDNPSAGSYTAGLFEAGTKRVAQKVGEEGVELSLAAVAGDREEIINEAADLFYHAIVLLAERDISLSEVVAKLEARHSES